MYCSGRLQKPFFIISLTRSLIFSRSNVFHQTERTHERQLHLWRSTFSASSSVPLRCPLHENHVSRFFVSPKTWVMSSLLNGVSRIFDYIFHLISTLLSISVSTRVFLAPLLIERQRQAHITFCFFRYDIFQLNIVCCRLESRNKRKTERDNFCHICSGPPFAVFTVCVVCASSIMINNFS